MAYRRTRFLVAISLLALLVTMLLWIDGYTHQAEAKYWRYLPGQPSAVQVVWSVRSDEGVLQMGRYRYHRSRNVLDDESLFVRQQLSGATQSSPSSWCRWMIGGHWGHWRRADGGRGAWFYYLSIPH